MIRYPLYILFIYAMIGVAYLYDGPSGPFYLLMLSACVLVTLVNAEMFAQTFSLLTPCKKRPRPLLEGGKPAASYSDQWPVFFFFAILIAPIPLTIWAYLYNPRSATFLCLFFASLAGYMLKAPTIWRGLQAFARFFSTRK